MGNLPTPPCPCGETGLGAYLRCDKKPCGHPFVYPTVRAEFDPALDPTVEQIEAYLNHFIDTYPKTTPKKKWRHPIKSKKN